MMLDILAHQLVMTATTAVLVYSNTMVWAIFGVGTIWMVYSVLKSALYAQSKHDGVRWEKGFADWFIVAKAITSAVGVGLMNVFREQGWYSSTTHYIVLFLLNLNIIEALVRDLELGYMPNALAAVGLLLTLPYSPSPALLTRLEAETSSGGLFVFPLSWEWILLYTSWNACFTYDDNLAPTTRLILLPPLFLAFAINLELWLSARVLLLLLHLIFRAIQIVWFYQPGKSTLTPVAGTVSNPKHICARWGQLNMIAVIVTALFTWSYSGSS